MLMMTRFHTITLLVLTALNVTASPALALSMAESYVPPEVIHADQLSRKVRVPARINLNQASVNELKTLPGIDENIAHKLIRLRPIEGIRDLYNLPWLNLREINGLIERLQDRVTF